MKILIVEDSAIQRELLRRALAHAGYEVILARDGVDGLALSQKHIPALIISDIAMPGMDGFEMCSKIKTIDTVKHIPVILLTALSDAKEIIRGLQSNADFYITKPYNEHYLLLSIESLLKDSAALSKTYDPEAGLKITFMGEEYQIKSNPRQILNLLLSTYENAVGKNHELIQAQLELKTLNEELEDKVRERTKELQASEESYKVLFENMFSGFYRFTPDGKFLSVNPAFNNMLGYSSKEELLSFCGELHCLYFRRKEYERFMVALKTNQSIKDLVSHLRKKDGSELIIEQNIRVVKNELGQPLYYEGFINDVTECKNAEAQLIKLSSAIIQSPVAVTITDLDGRIEFINPKFVEVTGYTRDEALGRTSSFLRSGHTDPEVYADLWETIKAGGIWQGELLNKRKDGSLYWNSITISPVRDAEAVITHYLSVNEDITNRKEVEEALRKAKEASEVANAAKSEFLANMSHEIRTPMNAIIGMTELVLDTDLKPRQKEYLDTVLNSANSLLSLLNSILDFSKIEAGKLELEDVSFNLREMVENICDPLSIQAHKKGLELSSHIKPVVPLRLIGDPVRLGQLLINLIGNALKFTDMGEIVVTVDMEQGLSSGKTATLLFSVSDTGIGIPSDKFNKIFEQFSQADGSMTRKYGGTGLGLAISRQLVSLMGGHLWLESVEGQGSTFHFTANFTLSDDQDTTSALDFKNARILISCNVNSCSSIIRDFLGGTNAEVTEAAGSKETYDRLVAARDSGRPYNIVFLDIRLSGGGGFKMAEQIMADASLACSLVMMLNTNHRGGDIDRCRELGVATYIIKPIKYKEIITTITELVNKSSSSAYKKQVRPTQALHMTDDAPVRILLVEDNVTNRVVAREILKKHGYNVTEAEDGEKALTKLLDEVKFDIILMDVQMPVMDGFEATKRIKASQETMTIPVIAMTAHALKGDRARCIEAGMDDYITKPVNSAELVEMVKKYTKPRREGSAAVTVDTPAPVRHRDAAIPPVITASNSIEADKLVVENIMTQIDKSQLIESLPHGDLRVFIEKAVSFIQTMRDALDNGNYSLTEKKAEAIKDNAETLSLMGIKTAAFRMMLALRKSDINNVNTHFKTLVEELDNLINKIHEGKDLK
ncbi:response regulator [Candidatus Magnetominusculus xianensis]|uniref:histidine kinase n=1 Tax=Candidatus Magnetominusculus xianensis TaxID=1748249 RepID=A0ABR5SGP0_9BACT|nr:response regulator [Candidatus Magnetominusculus xianensis]KWT90171.1 multi-sensor hybrid histidine kinase [Candidatus Magnetominusculus xianensis]MBF0403664.1 response regulator [Nitrospirota bacterium]